MMIFSKREFEALYTDLAAFKLALAATLAWHDVRVCRRAWDRDWLLQRLALYCTNLLLHQAFSFSYSGSSVHTKDSEDVTGSEEQVVDDHDSDTVKFNSSCIGRGCRGM